MPSMGRCCAPVRATSLGRGSPARTTTPSSLLTRRSLTRLRGISNAFGRERKTSAPLTRLTDTAVVSEAFRDRALDPRPETAASPYPSKQGVVGGVTLRGCESARTLLARIAAGLRQPQWRVALVPLVEHLSAENADFHAPRACVALCGQN